MRHIDEYDVNKVVGDIFGFIFVIAVIIVIVYVAIFHIVGLLVALTMGGCAFAIMTFPTWAAYLWNKVADYKNKEKS